MGQKLGLCPEFERRFLYKIELEKPGEEVRAMIWKTMVEGLDDEENFKSKVRKVGF